MNVADVEDTAEGGAIACRQFVAACDLLDAGKVTAWIGWQAEYMRRANKRYVAPWTEEKKAKFTEIWLAGEGVKDIAIAMDMLHVTAVYLAAKRIGLPPRITGRQNTKWRRAFEKGVAKRVARNKVEADRVAKEAKRQRAEEEAKQLKAARAEAAEALRHDKLRKRERERTRRLEERNKVAAAREVAALQKAAENKARAVRAAARAAKLEARAARGALRAANAAARKAATDEKRRLLDLRLSKRESVRREVERARLEREEAYIAAQLAHGDLRKGAQDRIEKAVKKAKKALPKESKGWTETQVDMLRELVGQGTSMSELETTFARSRDEIEGMGQSLGLWKLTRDGQMIGATAHALIGSSGVRKSSQRES